MKESNLWKPNERNMMNMKKKNEKMNNERVKEIW